MHPAIVRPGAPTNKKIAGFAPRACGDHVRIERPVNSSGAMSEASRLEVRAGLQSSLARLWRYALVLSKARDRLTTSCRPPACAPSSAPINLCPEHALTGGCSQFFARSGLTRYDRNEFAKAAVSSTRRMR